MPRRDATPWPGNRSTGWPALRASSARAPCPNRSGSAKQPEFSNEKTFPQEIPEQFSQGGLAEAGGGKVEEEEEEGDERGQSPQELVLLPTDMAPAPGRSGIAILTAMRGTSPHPGPRKGPHRVYFMKGCSSLPASQPHTSKLLPAPTAAAPARSRSPRPREPGQGLASWVLGAVPPREALARRLGAGGGGRGGGCSHRDCGNPENPEMPVPKRGTVGTCSLPLPWFPLAGAHGRPRHRRNALVRPRQSLR